MRSCVALTLTLLAVYTTLTVAQQPFSQLRLGEQPQWNPLPAPQFVARASGLSEFYPAANGQPGTWLVSGGFTRLANWSVSTLADQWISKDYGQTWTRIPDAPFARCEMASDLVTLPSGQKMLIATGGITWGSLQSFNDVWSTVDLGQTWQLMTNAGAFPPRTAHGMITAVSKATTTEYLVILGGYLYNQSYPTFMNDVYLSNDQGRTWITKNTAPWLGRGDAGIVSKGEQIFVFGGYGNWDATTQGFYNDVWTYLLESDVWFQQTPAAEWSGRWGMTAEVFNNTIVCIGGDRQWVKQNEVWVSWSNGANWTLVARANFSGRSDMTSEVINNFLYIIGGEDNVYNPNTSRYYMNNEIWATQIDYSTVPEDPTPVDPTPIPDPDKPQPDRSDGWPWTNYTMVTQGAFPARASGISALFPAVGPEQPEKWVHFGGFTRNNTWWQVELRDAWSTIDKGLTWKQENNPLPFSRLEMAGDVVLTAARRSVLIISGGVDLTTYNSYNDVWRSDDRGATFVKVTANAPWPGRAAHAMLTWNPNQVNQSLVIIGGYNLAFAKPMGAYNDVWQSFDMGWTWTQKSIAPWDPRGDFGAVVQDNGQIIIVGGLSTNNVVKNDCWMTKDLVTWSRQNAAPSFSGRWGMIVEQYRNDLVMIGGDTSGNQNQPSKSREVYISWNNGIDWVFIRNASMPARSDAVAEIIGGELFVVGGELSTAGVPAVSSEVWKTPFNYIPDPPTFPDDGGKGHGVNGGVVAIIVICVLLAVAAIAFGVYKYVNRKPGRPVQDSDYQLQQ